jgi:hypothetical protein
MRLFSVLTMALAFVLVLFRLAGDKGIHDLFVDLNRVLPGRTSYGGLIVLKGVLTRGLEQRFSHILGGLKDLAREGQELIRYPGGLTLGLIPGLPEPVLIQGEPLLIR